MSKEKINDDVLKAFEKALLERNYEEMERLIKDKPDLINANYSRSGSLYDIPLILAVRDKDTKLQDFLLGFEADIDLHYEPLIETVVSCADTRMFNFIKRKVSNFDSIKDLLITAAGAKLDNSEIVALLLEMGFDPNFNTRFGRITPLVRASESGQVKTVKLLIENNAEINRVTPNKLTALLYAVKNSHSEIVEILLKNGAKFNIQNINGDTPLHVAAKAGNSDIVKLLLEYGADTDIKNKLGKAASDVAKPKVKELLKVQAPVSNQSVSNNVRSNPTPTSPSVINNKNALAYITNTYDSIIDDSVTLSIDAEKAFIDYINTNTASVSNSANSFETVWKNFVNVNHETKRKRSETQESPATKRVRSYER